MEQHKPGSGLIELFKSLPTSWRLLRDPRMPLWTKTVPLGAVLYLLWPADLLVDPLLGLGQLDDVAVLLLAARLFIALAPPGLVGGRQGEAPSITTIDIEPSKVDDEGKTRLLTPFEVDDTP